MEQLKALVKDEIEKEYEYRLDKRDRKPTVKDVQMNAFWKLISTNN